MKGRTDEPAGCKIRPFGYLNHEVPQK